MLKLLVALTLFVPSVTEDERAPPLAVLAGDAPLRVDVTHGSRLIDAVLGSRLWAGVRATPEWQEALRSKKLREARSAATMFAGLLQADLEGAVRQILGREAMVALAPRDGADPAGLIAVRLPSAAEATRLFSAVHHFLTLVAQNDEFDDDAAIKTVNGEEFHAVVKDCFLVSNDRVMIEHAVDLAGRERAPIAGDRPSADEDGGIALTADLERLRGIGDGFGLPEVLDNALASLLVHGVACAINRAHHGRAALTLGDGGVHLAVDLDAEEWPDSATWFPSDRDPPQFASPAGTLAVLRVTRDFAAWYRERFTLLAPSLEDKLIEFDNVAAIFFNGRSFGDEVLPALGRDAALVVSAQTYADLSRPPTIQIPAFTLVVPIDDPALSKTDLLVAFQTTIGLINADRAQNGLAPFMQGTDRVDGVDVASARFLEEEGAEEAPDTRHNATPALAVAAGHLVLGSSKEAVASITNALQAATARTPDQPIPNTRLELEFTAIQAILARNEEPLIAGRMLEQGETRAEAERFWRRALAILELIDRGVVDLDRDQGGLHLRAVWTPADATATRGS